MKNKYVKPETEVLSMAGEGLLTRISIYGLETDDVENPTYTGDDDDDNGSWADARKQKNSFGDWNYEW